MIVKKTFETTEEQKYRTFTQNTTDTTDIDILH